MASNAVRAALLHGLLLAEWVDWTLEVTTTPLLHELGCLCRSRYRCVDRKSQYQSRIANSVNIRLQKYSKFVLTVSLVKGQHEKFQVKLK